MNKETRKNNYLKTYKFSTNSIDFRICSSKMLERWKNVQSFQLNQLVNGKFYFPKQLREVLLLKYDLWSKFLYEIENYCISHGDETIKQSDLEFCLDLNDLTFQKFNAITTEHECQFDNKFMEIYHQINEPILQYIRSEINILDGTNIDVFFTGLVNTVIKMLQHELIVLHEFQYLNNHTTKIPALIITEFNEHMFNLTGVCFCSKRAEIYKKIHNLSEVCVQNYTTNPINLVVADNIERLGIKINYKYSSRFDALRNNMCSNKD